MQATDTNFALQWTQLNMKIKMQCDYDNEINKIFYINFINIDKVYKLWNCLNAEENKIYGCLILPLYD